MVKPVILLCCALLFACSKHSTERDQSKTIADQRNAAPFTLSIVPSEDYDQGEKGSRIIYTGPTQTFFVVLTNTSDKPVTILEDWSSAGYWNLSFEAVTSEGKTVQLKKDGAVYWNRNYAAAFSIPPGGHYVFVEHFAKESWSELPKLFGPNKPVMLKAIFEQQKNEYALDHPLWIGRVESKPESFVISH